MHAKGTLETPRCEKRNGLRLPWKAAVAAASMSAAATIADAQGYSAISELFSSADGRVQFIQLTGVTPSQLAGMSLTTTSSDGVTQTYTFPANSQLLAPPFINQVLIASYTLTKQPHTFDGPYGGWAEEWDYVVPDGFVPLNGGTISLGSVDRWDYGTIPLDGYSALYRVGGIGVYSANSSAHGVVVVLDFSDVRFVSEFATDSFDRHFFTADPYETDVLESRLIPGWHDLTQDFPQGYTTFGGFGRRVEALSHPVCRLYLPPPDDSHFFSASEAECAAVQARFPEFVLEMDNVFYVGLPDPETGDCAHGLGPLYRLWNPATNDHWYTADLEVRRPALAQGYVPEGYGPDGVAMCVLLACSDPPGC